MREVVLAAATLVIPARVAPTPAAVIVPVLSAGFLRVGRLARLCSILHACRCIAGVACDLVNLSVLMERMAQIAAAIAPCPVICARPLYQACPDSLPGSQRLAASNNVSDSERWVWVHL